jgi:molybdopterin-guanine dinucleotide biosynthesis protein A
MQRDKASIAYGGRPQLERAMELIEPLVLRRFVSVRADQMQDTQRAAYDRITDLQADLGPIGGIQAALHTYPQQAWLVLACDLPFLDATTLSHLIAHRAPARMATAYRSRFDGLPEPLCAIFEPHSRDAVDAWIAAGQRCPRGFLGSVDVELLQLPVARALDNINTIEEYAAAAAAFDTTPPLTPASTAQLRHVTVRYFALLREQAGRSVEQLSTRADTAQELYEELRHRHGLSLAPESLRVAVNEEFSDWKVRLTEGDTVVFLPPVAGG